jgi:aerobic-type carbon monoxide dehydrogenase small subunit (CoxS/CutS family)
VKESVRFVVNGDPVEVAVEPGATLLECLRQDLGLTGSKQGCDKGDCGACTVLLDGRAVLACLVLARAVEGRRVTTVEGLAEAGRLHPLQEAFDTQGAAQCGFCTPGMLMSAYALIEENDQPNRQDVREALAGNLCRCTGYTKILDAVVKAAGEVRQARAAPRGGDKP